MNTLFRCPFCHARCATGPELTEAMVYCDPPDHEGLPAVIHEEPVCPSFAYLPSDKFLKKAALVLTDQHQHKAGPQ